MRKVEEAVVAAKGEALTFFGLPQGTPRMQGGLVQGYGIWAQGSRAGPGVDRGVWALALYGLRMKRPGTGRPPRPRQRRARLAGPPRRRLRRPKGGAAGPCGDRRQAAAAGTKGPLDT